MATEQAPKYVIQVWSIGDLELIEDGADADSLLAKMTLVAHGLPEAEKVVAALDNCIQLSGDSEIREGWIISMNELNQTLPGSVAEVVELFIAVEQEEITK